MSETHTLRVQPRISVLSHTQVELTARLAKLIHHLHLFIPSVRSTSIRPDEEALRAQLEAIEAELRRPGGLGRVGGRIGELWGLVGRIRGQKETGRLGTDKEAGWAVVDGATFEDIKQVGILRVLMLRFS
jgi:nuclear pore complex protein Nup54